MRNVVMLIDNLNADAGGAERFLVGLATHLPRERYRVTVVTSREAQGPLLDALLAGGVRHVGLARRGRFDLLAWRRLIALLRSERPEILHAHKFGSNLWGAVIGRLCRVPVVIAHEQTWDYSRRLRRLLDGRVIGRLCDAFVAVSSEDARRMAELERVPASKIEFIPNAYLPRPWAGRSDVRGELGLHAATPLVGAATMLRPQKALEVLIGAFAEVRRRRPDAHLVIAGDGPERSRLAATAERLGLGDAVHLLGAREDAVSIIGQLDVAALSSDFEGTPLYVFECMAAGVPLVATAVGGLPDVVEDGVSGVLVKPRDEAALGGAIGDLLDDRERAHALAAAAELRLPAYTAQAVTQRFTELYDRLLDRS